MHRFMPPAIPGDFDRKVQRARNAVQAKIDLKEKPVFAEVWGKFKDAISAAQHRKCGFCEQMTVGVTFGDVEHFSPKSEVKALDDDPATWGRERPNLATVVGRTTVPLSEIGYWWRAYSWDNYLLACTVCNQQWKMAIFPVQEQPRGLPPADQITETPLLLNPFFGPHPKDHLEFGRMGEVKARNGSRMGFETIRTCGLDRPSLWEARKLVARRTHRRIDDLSQIVGSEFDRVLRDIYEDGDEAAPHCGMVRAIYEQRTGTSWDDLRQLVDPQRP